MTGRRITTCSVVIALVMVVAAWLGSPTARAEYGAYGGPARW